MRRTLTIAITLLSAACDGQIDEGCDPATSPEEDDSWHTGRGRDTRG